jgi:hypothetical protein
LGYEEHDLLARYGARCTLWRSKGDVQQSLSSSSRLTIANLQERYEVRRVLNHHRRLEVLMRIAAIAIASLLLAVPAAAQTTSPGKSGTAPGQTGKTPGQKQQKDDMKTGKDYAPGQNQKKPGGAKNINPGSTQRK